jgi:hypothetical protein
VGGAVEAIDRLGLEAVEVLARDDDELSGLLAGAGFVAGDNQRSGET